MDGNLSACGVALAIVIDVVMVAFFWRYALCLLKRKRQSSAGYSACDLPLYDDDDAFGTAGSNGISHGLLTNPASGLPMLDGVWMDVAGNPYGTDFNDAFGSSCGGFESNSCDSECGLHG